MGGKAHGEVGVEGGMGSSLSTQMLVFSCMAEYEPPGREGSPSRCHQPYASGSYMSTVDEGNPRRPACLPAREEEG